MARPRKRGLDYFTMDVDFFNDIKVRKLIRRKGGSATIIYQCLLCLIYKDGYYVKYDEDTAFVVSELTGLEEDYIEDVIKTCVALELFDKNVFEQSSVLTSRSIQDRYFEASKRRKSNAGLPYLVKTGEELEAESSHANTVQNGDFGEKSIKKRVNVAETTVNVAETPINVAESTQRKEKKSKVKENTAVAVKKKVFDNNNDNKNSKEDFDFEKAFAEIENDLPWQAEISKRTGTTGEEVARRLAEFRTHCICIAKRDHIDMPDFRRHFVSWYDKQLTLNAQRNNETYELSQYQRRRGFEPNLARGKSFNGTF